MQQSDWIVGMKSICDFLGGISEPTALKWHRQLELPIKKMSKGKDSGVWVGSKSKLNTWLSEYTN